MATSARNWKKPQQTELTLPSGNTCLIKRPGLENLLTAGVLPDSLMPIAMEAIARAQTGAPTGPKKPTDRKKKVVEEKELDADLMQKFMQQENALSDIFVAFDKVTAMCVVDPQVAYHKRQKFNEDGHPLKDTEGRDVWEEIPLAERSEDFLYTDDVDGKDKEFIFNFAAGGEDESAGFPDAGDDVATP